MDQQPAAACEILFVVRQHNDPPSCAPAGNRQPLSARPNSAALFPRRVVFARFAKIALVTSEAVTQDRVYRAMKARLLHATISAGSRLEIASLAQLYGVSQTPIREVLGRLVGEGLVEHREEGGYRIWLPDRERLRDLYYWNAQHLLAALHVVREPVIIRVLEPLRARAPSTALEQVALTAQVFQAIGDATGNVEFSERIRSTSERLHGIRLAEVRVFTDTATETARMLALGRIGVQKNVRRKILAYHRRRFEHVSQILEILEAEAHSPLTARHQ